MQPLRRFLASAGAFTSFLRRAKYGQPSNEGLLPLGLHLPLYTRSWHRSSGALSAVANRQCESRTWKLVTRMTVAPSTLHEGKNISRKGLCFMAMISLLQTICLIFGSFCDILLTLRNHPPPAAIIEKRIVHLVVVWYSVVHDGTNTRVRYAQLWNSKRCSLF